MATVKHPQFRAGASGPRDPGYGGEAVLNEDGASGDAVAFIAPNASEAEAAEALAMARTARTDQDKANRPPPQGGSGDPHLEAGNSTVDDWFGQRAARDADLADDLMEETGDERTAEQLFNEEQEGAPDRGDMAGRRSDPDAPGTGVNTSAPASVPEPNEPA